MRENSLCESCYDPLHLSNVVVSRGNPFSKLMIIGEAPGAKEEELGKPFVGRSGKLLDQLLKEIGINSQTDAYVCNVVKCRPPNNRRPSKSEILQSFPWLRQQIKLVDPSVMVLVGATAVESVLGIRISQGISKLRGTWQNWEGRSVMPIFHPSYLLRNPSKEDGAPLSLTKLDLLKVKEKLYTFELSSSEQVSITSRAK